MAGNDPQTQPPAILPVDEPLARTTPPPIPTQASQEAHSAEVHAAAAAVMVMPGSAARNANEIEAISPEGRPADSKFGPASIRRLMVVLGLFILAASAVSAIWIGWAAIAVAVFGTALLFFNPAMWAAMARTHDREKVIEHRINSGEFDKEHAEGRPRTGL